MASVVRQLVAAHLCILHAACAPRAGFPGRVPNEQASRIERVLHGLRPRVEVAGALPVRWTLVERMAAYRVPAVSIAVIDSGRIAWAHGFGVKAAGSRDSTTAKTIFQAGSISKPVAVTAMLRLLDRQVLSLDSNVNRYLTTWQLPSNRFTEQQPITPRLLANHSASTTVSGFPGYSPGARLPTVLEILDGTSPANTQAIRVDSTPGLRFRYSGGGTTILQQLLADVAGKPFQAVARDEVLVPLGMTRSAYEQPLASAREGDAARAHDRAGTTIGGRWNAYPELAAAGLWTTPSDLARWALAIDDARAGRSASFLSPTTVAEMFRTIPGRSARERVGLGIFLGDSGRDLSFYHGGETEGFLAYLVMLPHTRQGAVIMINGANAALLAEIAYAIGAEYGWPAYGQYPRPMLVPMVAVDSTNIAQFVGEYTLNVATRRTTALIQREGVRLFMHGSWATLREELYPTSSTTFISADNARRISFGRNSGGQLVLTMEIGPGSTLTGIKN